MAGQDGGTNHNKDWDVNKKNITTINTLIEGTQTTEVEEKGDVSIVWSIIDVFEVEEQ